MKKGEGLSWLLKASISVASALPGLMCAQGFTVLHSFPYGAYGSTGLGARLAASGETLFGTENVLFKLNTDGKALKFFDELSVEHGFLFLQDELIASDGTLYGGGHDTNDVVFKANTDGTGYQVLHIFTAVSQNTLLTTNDDGVWPLGKLVLSGTSLFGTASGGGNGGSGTLFRVKTDGTGFRVIHSFSVSNSFDGSWEGLGVAYTNADGGTPRDLVLSGNALYGTTITGGPSSAGTIFKINIDGTGFTVLHNFAPRSGKFFNFDGPEGGEPGGLIVSGTTLYGTTYLGTSYGNGTIFKINTDGTGFATLHRFSGPSKYFFDFSRIVTNLDGAIPTGLVLAGNNLYGTASDGGESGAGTVFSLNTDGSGFRTLYNFSGTISNSQGYYTNSDGSGPNGVLLIGATLYGTTSEAGGGGGTVFAMSLPPELSLASSGSNFILSWPTNFTGYTLQSATNLSSPVWSTNLPSPAIVNDKYSVTNSISRTQRFFRLSQ